MPLVVPRGDVIGEVGIVFVQERVYVSHRGHILALPLRIHQRHERSHHRGRSRGAIDEHDQTIHHHLVVVREQSNVRVGTPGYRNREMKFYWNIKIFRVSPLHIEGPHIDTIIPVVGGGAGLLTSAVHLRQVVAHCLLLPGRLRIRLVQ